MTPALKYNSATIVAKIVEKVFITPALAAVETLSSPNAKFINNSYTTHETNPKINNPYQFLRIEFILSNGVNPSAMTIPAIPTILANVNTCFFSSWGSRANLTSASTIIKVIIG